MPLQPELGSGPAWRPTGYEKSEQHHLQHSGVDSVQEGLHLSQQELYFYLEFLHFSFRMPLSNGAAPYRHRASLEPVPEDPQNAILGLPVEGACDFIWHPVGINLEL